MTDVLQPSPATLRDSIPTRMTWDEYFAWDFEDCHAEWVDGQVVVLPPMRASENLLIGSLFSLVARFVEDHSLGYVFVMTFLMRLHEKPSARLPDLMFLSAGHSDRLTEYFVDGPADLAVEVVSPESDLRDRATKFLEYEASGIPEYWLIDPLRKDAYFYLLGEDGRYHLAPTSSDGIFRSRMLEGFRLKVDWLWRAATLDPADVLTELAD